MTLSLQSHLLNKPCSPYQFWPVVLVHMCLGVCILNEFTEIKVKTISEIEWKEKKKYIHGQGLFKR